MRVESKKKKFFFLSLFSFLEELAITSNSEIVNKKE